MSFKKKSSKNWQKKKWFIINVVNLLFINDNNMNILKSALTMISGYNSRRNKLTKEKLTKEIWEEIDQEAKIKYRKFQFDKEIWYIYKAEVDGPTHNWNRWYTGWSGLFTEKYCMSFNEDKITELLKKYNNDEMAKLLTITKILYKEKIKQQTKQYNNPTQDDIFLDPKDFLLKDIIQSYTSKKVNLDNITYKDLAKWYVILNHSDKDTIPLQELIDKWEELYNNTHSKRREKRIVNRSSNERI